MVNISKEPLIPRLFFCVYQCRYLSIDKTSKIWYNYVRNSFTYDKLSQKLREDLACLKVKFCRVSDKDKAIIAECFYLLQQIQKRLTGQKRRNYNYPSKYFVKKWNQAPGGQNGGTITKIRQVTNLGFIQTTDVSGDAVDCFAFRLRDLPNHEDYKIGRAHV